MLETAVVALMFAVAASAYLAGRLIERSQRLKENCVLLAQTHLELRAFQNQLLVKQGMPPIFKENGIISLSHVPDAMPLNQVIRPPFAQAELDWENEEEKPLTTAQAMGAFVPVLSPEEKEMILNNLKR